MHFSSKEINGTSVLYIRYWARDKFKVPINFGESIYYVSISNVSFVHVEVVRIYTHASHPPWESHM